MTGALDQLLDYIRAQACTKCLGNGTFAHHSKRDGVPHHLTVCTLCEGVGLGDGSFSRVTTLNQGVKFLGTHKGKLGAELREQRRDMMKRRR